MNSHWITTSAAPCLFMILFVYLSLISSLIFLCARARTGSLILLATVSGQRVEAFGLSYKPTASPPPTPLPPSHPLPPQPTSTPVGEISRLGRSSVREGPPPWQAAAKSCTHVSGRHCAVIECTIIFPPLIHRSYHSSHMKSPHYLLHFSVNVLAPQK